MRAPKRYSIATHLTKSAGLLDLPIDKVLRRAGLPANYLSTPERGLTASAFFDVWQVVLNSPGQIDLGVRLGTLAARGPFVPIVFAFSCSPNIEIGIRRMGELKTSEAPIAIDVQMQDDALLVAVRSTEQGLSVPPALAQFKLAYLLECGRLFTGHNIRPIRASAQDQDAGWTAMSEVTGCPVEIDNRDALYFSIEDARRPLITRNDALWDSFGAHLRKKNRDKLEDVSLADQVRDVLLDSLPAGQSGVENTCRRMNMTRRTLQRRLKAEGFTFQEILDATRQDLSEHYLHNTKLTAPEISYLLGYQEPRSFFRAFRSWTGRTPMDVRLEKRNEAARPKDQVSG